jgi:alpha-beta hydrolase superfamily lysophospholipase
VIAANIVIAAIKIDDTEMDGLRKRQQLALAGVVASAASLATWYAGRHLIVRTDPDPYLNPGRLGLPFKAVAFPSRDGITIRGWHIPAHSRRATVVICPGHFGSMHSDLVYVPWLCDAGYDVLFDWRGRGRSDGGATSLGILERRDLLGALDWLTDQGVERLGVLGFSMGAAVAIATSPLAPNIAAVVADSPFPRVRDTIVTGMIQRGVPRPVAQLAAPPLIWSASLQSGVDLTLIDPMRWAAFVSAPLLLMSGGRDPYLPTSAAQELFNRASEPKELWSVPDVGHRELYSCRHAGYEAQVLGFFDKWLPAGV